MIGQKRVIRLERKKPPILCIWMPKYCVVRASWTVCFRNQVFQLLGWRWGVGCVLIQWTQWCRKLFQMSVLTWAALLLGHACCICSLGDSLHERFDSLLSAGAGERGQDPAIKVVGIQWLTIHSLWGWANTTVQVWDLWMGYSQAHSRKKMFQMIFSRQ